MFIPQNIETKTKCYLFFLFIRLCESPHIYKSPLFKQSLESPKLSKRQGISIDRKLCNREYTERKIFRVLLEQLIMYNFSKLFMRRGILLGDILCDRVQGVEKFPRTSVTSIVQYPPWALNGGERPKVPLYPTGNQNFKISCFTFSAN